MKYLLLVLVCFLIGCTRNGPKTLDFCINEVKTKINFNSINAPREKKAEAEIGIYTICKEANNDPDKALSILDNMVGK
jgi:hypothetical protein